MIVSSLLGTENGILPQFCNRADELAKQVSLKIERHDEGNGDFFRRTHNYILINRREEFILNVVGEVLLPVKHSEWAEKKDIDSFINAHFKVLFGEQIISE